MYLAGPVIPPLEFLEDEIVGQLRLNVIAQGKELKRLAQYDALQKLLADVQEPGQYPVPAGKIRRRTSAYRQPAEQPEPNVTYVPRGFWRSLASSWKKMLVVGMVSMACMGVIGCSLVNPIWGMADRWEYGNDIHPRTKIEQKAIGYAGDSEANPTEVMAVNHNGTVTVLVQPLDKPEGNVKEFRVTLQQGVKGNDTPVIAFEDRNGDNRLDIVVKTTPHGLWQNQHEVIILNTKDKGLILASGGTQ